MILWYDAKMVCPINRSIEGERVENVILARGLPITNEGYSILRSSYSFETHVCIYPLDLCLDER